jgi:hypothetical protein
MPGAEIRRGLNLEPDRRPERAAAGRYAGAGTTELTSFWPTPERMLDD